MTEISENRRQTLFPMTTKQYWSLIGRVKYPALFKIAKPITKMFWSSYHNDHGQHSFKIEQPTHKWSCQKNSFYLHQLRFVWFSGQKWLYPWGWCYDQWEPVSCRFAFIKSQWNWFTWSYFLLFSFLFLI